MAAYNAKMRSLAQGFAEVFVDGDAHRTKQAEEIAFKGLRGHQYSRVNPFDIFASLEGLEEKFRIFNREDLADALQIRQQELSKFDDKWIPDILSLFLTLSDCPVEKTKLASLALLKAPEPQPALTWAEILADDPLVEQDVWDDVTFSASSSSSSGDEDIADEPPAEQRSPHKHHGVKSALSAHIPLSIPNEALVEAADLTLLHTTCAQLLVSKIEPQLASLSTNDASAILPALEMTELQIIRETLFLLRGLPTLLFQDGINNARTMIHQEFFKSETSSIPGVLATYTYISSKLQRLRAWCATGQQIPLLQGLQAIISGHLRDYDCKISDLERRYTAPQNSVTVSILELLAQVQEISRVPLDIADFIASLTLHTTKNPFLCLETLYQRASSAQACGDAEMFGYAGRAFFRCLEIYLKPVRRWMEHGELESESDLFFVEVTNRRIEADSLWHHRYSQRLDSKGALFAPKFLRPSVSKIFNTGKSVVFLKELGAYESVQEVLTLSRYQFDFDTVCNSTTGIPFTPFPELLSAALSGWVDSKHDVASTTLRQRLEIQCGLWRAFDNMEYIYLCKDGSSFREFAEEGFQRLHASRTAWSDRYLLTELAQRSYGSIRGIDSRCLVARTSSNMTIGRSVKDLAVLQIDYHLPWSISNIIQRHSCSTYNQIFVFNLQVYRAQYALQHLFIGRRLRDHKTHDEAGEEFLLCQKLLRFVDTLRSYLGETVLSKESTKMRQSMTAATDMDTMVTLHEEHISELKSHCLLAEKTAPIYQAILALLDLAVHFSDVQAQATDEKRTSPQGPEPGSNHGLGEGDNNPDRAQTKQPILVHNNYGQRLTEMRQQFDDLSGFVVSGLRTVGRANGKAYWVMLAEKLDWPCNKKPT